MFQKKPPPPLVVRPHGIYLAKINRKPTKVFVEWIETTETRQRIFHVVNLSNGRHLKLKNVAAFTEELSVRQRTIAQLPDDLKPLVDPLW